MSGLGPTLDSDYGLAKAPAQPGWVHALGLRGCRHLAPPTCIGGSWASVWQQPDLSKLLLKLVCREMVLL